MSWTYETTRKGYSNLWLKAALRPERKATVLARARKIVTNRSRYQQLEVKTGVPWWWIAVAHNLEGGGRWDTYLGNGQSITRRTTIEPLGRGPFKTFEEGAIDAINLKKLSSIKVWDIPRALFHWEQFNGFGYVSKRINSPYVWSMTTLYSKGKYVVDHVYDPNAVSDQIGGAAMLLALIELGEINIGKEEKTMAELQATLLPFGGIAPTLIRVLAGPAASLAVRVLADAIEEASGTPVPAKVADVKQHFEALLPSVLVRVLQHAEDMIGELVPVPELPPVRAEESIPAAPAATPSTTTGPMVMQPVSPEPTKLDKATGGWLTGWKTVLGIGVYCAASIAVSLGYLPADVGNAIMTAGGGLAGVGVIAKIERWLPLFAGFLKVKAS